MRHPYIPPPSGGHPRPELIARVHGPNGFRNVWGLIDPSRTVSTIPLDIGRRIGVVSSEDAELDLQREAEVDVEILIGEQLVRWSTTVTFSETDPEARWGLRGFLDHFDVLLRGPLGYFTVDVAEALPPPRYP